MAKFLVFKNARLVCRLRKSSPSRTPTGPSAGSSTLSPVIPPEALSTDNPMQGSDPKAVDPRSPESQPPTPSPLLTPPKNRYFIMKSLTKEDLAWSVANNIWATQPHNESILNEAFKVWFLTRHNLHIRTRKRFFSSSVSIKAVNFMDTLK